MSYEYKFTCLIVYLPGWALFYKKRPGLKTKVVCGAEEANTIFVDFHAGLTGAHGGQTRTRDAIYQRFYWPGMTGDIDKRVRMGKAVSSQSN